MLKILSRSSIHIFAFTAMAKTASILLALVIGQSLAYSSVHVTTVKNLRTPLFPGAYPHRGVIQGSDGALYGTTDLTDNSPVGGTVFRINTNGTAFTLL